MIFQHSASGVICYIVFTFHRLAISAICFLIVFDHFESGKYMTLLHIIVTYRKYNYKMMKIIQSIINLKTGNKSPTLFLKKSLCAGNLLPTCKILIERPEIRKPDSFRLLITPGGSHETKNLMGMLLPMSYKKMPVYHTWRKSQCDGSWIDKIAFQWPDQYKQLQINKLVCWLKLQTPFIFSDFQVIFSLNSFSYWLEEISPPLLKNHAVKQTACNNCLGESYTCFNDRLELVLGLTYNLDLLTHLIGESTAC